MTIIAHKNSMVYASDKVYEPLDAVLSNVDL